MTSPLSALKTPVAREPVPDLVQQILEVTDYLSLSSLARRFFTEVMGYDPLEGITQHFAGDWSQVSRSADALRNLGEFLQVYADEFGIATRAVRADWDGHAADAATLYFNRCGASVAGHVNEFNEIAAKYDEMARAMWDCADVVGGLITGAMDAALIMAASAAVGVGTSWTGVGGALGGIGTAAAGIALAAQVKQIVDALDAAVALTEAGSAVVRGISARLASFEGISLPAAYDHPFAVQPQAVQP